MSTTATTQEWPRKKPEPRPDHPFVRNQLPWLIAGVAFVWYLLTLNHWITFSNLFEVARASGWVWQPDVSGPLAWIVAEIARVLPFGARPLALNVFAALCAALALGLLARAVSIWPHDRTHDQRQRERPPHWFLSIKAAWFPPVLAALICGLQLTFWEHATKAASPSPPWGSGLEMLDVLLFAYIIRALLEFRISQKESWLLKAALVYGLTLPENWAMIAYFPLFLAALIWIRGLAFFNVNFLLRLFLFGLAGAAFYLLLPILQATSSTLKMPFWNGLHQSVAVQKTILSTAYATLKDSPQVALVLALSSLIPLLLISIRWAAYFGDTSKLGVGLTTWAFHIVHAAFLVLCLWMALDPPFSPRFQALAKGAGVSFLTLWFLSALVIGYMAGYFLLIFSAAENPKRTPPLTRFVGRCATVLVWVLGFATVLMLVARNLPQVRASNGSLVRDYAREIVARLPGKAVLLSDDSRRLTLVRAQALQQNRARDFLFLDTAGLKYPDYQRVVKQQQWWPYDIPNDSTAFGDLDVALLMLGLSETNQIDYLHPSFGYFFEAFVIQPHGVAYELQRAPTNTLEAPRLTPAVLSQNSQFWTAAQADVLDPLGRALNPGSEGNQFLKKLWDHLHLQQEPNRELVPLGTYYSRSLDFWGVELQRNGQIKDAGPMFDQAVRLNPDNVVARLNLHCNHELQAGRSTWTNQLSANLTDELGKYRNLQDVMNDNGPFDDPRICFQQGIFWARTGLYRQAANQFARAAALAPGNLSAELWLAQLNIQARLPDKALDIIAGVRANPARYGLSLTNENELLFVETSARLAKGDLKSAAEGVDRALERSPNDPAILKVAQDVYTKYGFYTNSLDILNRELKLTPNNPELLLSKGYTSLQMGDYTNAVETLTHLLATETNSASELHNTALLDRAISYLRAGQLEQARRDYEALEKAFPTAYRIKFGLGEIAYRKKETNTAVRYFQQYLANAPTNTDEANKVREKLKEIRPGYPQVQ